MDVRIEAVSADPPAEVQPVAASPAAVRLTFAVVGAVALAAALITAFGGFLWGLPDATHIQSYHPDEQNITYSLRNMDPAQRDFNPRFFGNPTFYTYQVGALAYAAKRAGLIDAEADARWWLEHPEAVRSFYILGRELSFAYAILAGVLVYCLARRFTSDRFAALAAAVIFASLPVTAVHSHYMTVNAAAVFWAVAAMLFAVRVQEKPSWPNYALAGLCTGLAISTKLNNAFLPLAVITAHLLSPTPLSARKVFLSGRLYMAGALAGTAFFAGSPYYALSFRTVAGDAHNRMNVAALFDFSTPPAVVLKDFWNHWSAASGWVLAGVFLIILPVAFVFGPRRRLAPLFAVAFPFLLVAVKSGWWAFPSRVWPLLAFLSVITAVMLFTSRRAMVAAALAAPVVAGLLVTIPWNAAYARLAGSEHIREESSRWIEANIPPDSRIIVLDTPYYEDPNIVYQNALHPEHANGVAYTIINLEGSLDSLAAAQGKWLVVPEHFDAILRAKIGMGVDEYARKNGFELATTFSRDFEAFGVILRSWVPADMVQNYPVFIYRRSPAPDNRGAARTTGIFEP